MKTAIVISETSSNHNTGYKGRTAIHEVLEVNSEMRQMIFDNESQIDMKKLAMKNGMTPLRDAQNNIVDYRVMMNHSDVEQILRPDLQIDSVFADMRSSAIDRRETIESDKRTVELLVYEQLVRCILRSVPFSQKEL